MPKPNTEPITQSIDSLRTESSPDSVTPARVANLLQAIVDLINALSMVPDSEVANIMQLINNAVSTAQAASTTASAAQTAANNKLISQFKADANDEGVTLTIKQTGHTAKSFLLPVADATQAGIVLPSTLQSLLNADQKAENYKVATLLLSYTSSGVRFGIRMSNGTTLEKDIGLATTLRNGIMSKTDKAKLDNLPSSGLLTLDAAGRVPAAQAPHMMLRNINGAAPDDLHNGDFYFDVGPKKIYYVPDINEEVIELGPPSKNVIYCHVDTNITYRWTGSEFVPTLNAPNYAMQRQEVRRNNTTQKIYNIPNGVLAVPIITTDAANIQLVPSTVGASVHRILLLASNLGNVETINWPGDIAWTNNNTMPDLATIDACEGCLVTVYDCLFAEFHYYG